MSKKPVSRKKVLDKAMISGIMRTVSRHEGFHFYREQGDATGKVATSLPEFVKQLGAVDVRSVNFHFKRRDFEKWIHDIIGDIDLATKFGKIRKATHGEKLRNELVQIVNRRLDELTAGS
jgi:hypothetical protein